MPDFSTTNPAESASKDLPLDLDAQVQHLLMEIERTCTHVEQQYAHLLGERAMEQTMIEAGTTVSDSVKEAVKESAAEAEAVTAPTEAEEAEEAVEEVEAAADESPVETPDDDAFYGTIQEIRHSVCSTRDCARASDQNSPASAHHPWK